MNGAIVQIAYNPNDEDEYKENGETHVPIEGHKEAAEFLEALEALGGDAAIRIEELLQTVYELGIEKGKKLERAKHQPVPTNQPSLGMRR